VSCSVGVGYDARCPSLRNRRDSTLDYALFPQLYFFGVNFPTHMDLDRFDRQLLNLVQKDSAQTAERLAEQVGLSPSAIQRRLKKMREQGVIVRDVAVVDPRAVGRPTFFVVSLSVEAERPELLAKLREWIGAHAEIQQAYYVTGETDYVLIVTARDTEAFDATMSRLVKENPNVRRFTTNVALGVLKQGLSLPVPIDDDPLDDNK
jgi:Lrp/AsnC family transcriptional regulator, leucine-responsive regulatory protein